MITKDQIETLLEHSESFRTEWVETIYRTLNTGVFAANLVKTLKTLEPNSKIGQIKKLRDISEQFSHADWKELGLNPLNGRMGLADAKNWVESYSDWN